MSHGREIALRVVSAVIGMTTLLAVVELTFWILPVREASPRFLPSGDDRIARFHPNEQWRYAAGWDFFIVNEMRTNNAGWASEIDYVREADTPLLAFVGDSFVEGNHLPWGDTCHGRLTGQLEGELRVYSFGMSTSPLSQYLAYAEHARDTYWPDAMVIPIIENDFDQSLPQFLKPSRYPLLFTFKEQSEGGLMLASPTLPSKEEPTSLVRRLRRWVNQHSRLLQYRLNHVRSTWVSIHDERRRNDRHAAGMPGTPFHVTDPAAAHRDRVAESRRSVDAFLRMLPERSGLAPQQIVFVVDGIRPYRYTEDWEHRWNGSYHDVMRRYFMDEARADGYEVIDMQPVFVDHYRSHRQPFNWLRDNHWNALGHGLCAEQVGRSQALHRLQAGTAALETE